MLDLLGRGVDLLLALLGTTTQAQDEVQGGLLLDVVVRQSPAVLELLASEDQTLLIRGDTLLVCSRNDHRISIDVPATQIFFFPS